jgi:hypothetical protein
MDLAEELEEETFLKLLPHCWPELPKRALEESTAWFDRESESRPGTPIATPPTKRKAKTGKTI